MTWGGVPLDTAGRVVHLDFEQGAAMTQLRYRRLAFAVGAELAPLERALDVRIFPELRLTDSDAEGELTALCQDVALLVVDSLRAAADGDEDKSSRREALDVLTRVSERTRAVAVVVAHEGKVTEGNRRRPTLQRLRGSSSIADGAGAVLSFHQRDPRSPVIITPTKSSNRAMPEPWAYEQRDVGGVDDLTGVAEGLDLVAVNAPTTTTSTEQGDAVEGRVLVFVAAHPGCSSREIRDGATGGNGPITQAVERLSAKGVIVNTGSPSRARWHLSEAK